MRTDCLLDTGRECVFGDNVELDLVSAGCTGSFTGGDMAGMFFGTVLLVLLLEVRGFLSFFSGSCAAISRYFGCSELCRRTHCPHGARWELPSQHAQRIASSC